MNILFFLFCTIVAHAVCLLENKICTKQLVTVFVPPVSSLLVKDGVRLNLMWNKHAVGATLCGMFNKKRSSDDAQTILKKLIVTKGDELLIGNELNRKMPELFIILPCNGGD